MSAIKNFFSETIDFIYKNLPNTVDMLIGGGTTIAFFTVLTIPWK
jgi:hypothetical protein